MATVIDKSGNGVLGIDEHIPSKLEAITLAVEGGSTPIDYTTQLNTLNTSVQAVKSSVDAHTPILNDIKTNTTPVTP